MTVDNLGPTASGMNFGKYSAQNDVCSFIRLARGLLRRNQMRPFNFYIVCPIVSLQSNAAVITVTITARLTLRRNEKLNMTR